MKKKKLNTRPAYPDFDLLFNDLYPPLVVFANKYINNIHECEGIVQDIFIKYWLNAHPSKNKKTEIKSYLYRSVYNRCIDFFRYNSVKEKRLKDYKYFQKDFENIKDLILESELKVRIEKAVNTLPKQCKKVFLLSRDSGLTYKEIACELDISVKTVETQIGKALKILRQQLSEVIVTLFSFSSQKTSI